MRNIIGETWYLWVKFDPRSPCHFRRRNTHLKPFRLREVKILRFLGPSSTWAYTRQVIVDIKKYLNQPDSPDIPIHTDGHAYEFDWSLAEDKPFSKRELPSWDYALYLMNTVKFHIGQLYHLFDEATFTEGLHAFYHDRASEIPHFNLWYIQYLLVITFGKLFLVQRAPEDPPPGAIFFARAMRLLPDIKDLYQDILLSLEILCGIALYLQCIDHRNTAYVYLGIALRIALTQGLHRDVDVESSSEHLSSRYRSIWWTLYILDRRFSSLMGAPISIQDSDVTMRLVNSEMADHRSEALVMNVKLSRIITSVLHCSVQRVLISLAELAPELQSRFGLSGSSEESISRVAGTLNLCYHQSVVLATRPVLVYILFEKLSVPSAGRAITEPIKALIKACFESAEKSLRILTALRSQDLLEAFLPFDIDCTHSSAFVILLIKAICLVPDISDCQTSYVDLATRILNTMIQKGSVTAQHRLSELQVLQDLLILLSERSTVLGEPESTDMVSRSGPMLGGARTDVDVDQSGIEGVSAFPYYVDAIGDTGLSSAEMLEVARLLEWGDLSAEMPSEETQQRQDIACDQENPSM
ncbi:hypothetical protein ASPBRDRAFT_112450 [Aspergillus brasiliensis CBS 101740]|uniref:Xylanolytic transcriptional activator regulatory domain-containing protein n=1 Tax=Aspergillus brasiliensis (strain CBS 101740 / IMI 381727 / IBT 21946) TaxID=767769 RepID=A0A1L9V2N1_ASPBC|nr:hypothetical protein ASPBRDRAFT_112450 [Aspergillus brasiliensis CBS 101740]